LESNFSLRNSTFDDTLLLFNWANDPIVRNNAINSSEILWEDHLTWFENKIKSNNCQIFIFLKNGAPIGQIRLELNAQFWVIDYSIDLKFRGMGYGNKIITLIKQEKIRPLKAIVKKTNTSSNKIFINCGFQFKEIEINDEAYFEYIYY